MCRIFLYLVSGLTTSQFPSLSGPTCAGEVCSFQDAVTDIPSFRDAPDLEVVGISSGTSITNNINIIIIIPSSGTCLYHSRCTYTVPAFPTL
jgi:hypothetical protein